MEASADLASAVDAAVGTMVGVLDAAWQGSRIDVSPTQFRVLTIIDRNPGTNLNGLAAALDVVPSSASRLCDRLAATGMLRRVTDPRDRREVQLTLTATAQRLLDELRQRRRQAIEVVLARMPAAAQEELVRSLAAFAVAAAHDGSSAEPPQTALPTPAQPTQDPPTRRSA